MSGLQVVGLVVLGVSMFPLIWSFVCIAISSIGGWRKLAAAYRTSQPFGGKLQRFQTARMRAGARYKGCLNVGASPSGLFLSTYFPFRPGHPPLLVPWQDVTVRPYAEAAACELRFKAAPSIPLQLSSQLAAVLEADAGRDWPTKVGG